MEREIRVLLVDDEADFVETIAYWLRMKGYVVQKAEHGGRALETIAQQAPDAVVLDVNMPDMDGIEVLRRIRALHRTLPVILVTAASADENRFAGAKALGISGFFPKGSDLARLGELLEIALRMLQKPADAAPSADAAPPARTGSFLRNLFRRPDPP
jgi:CheY-like chemotaxis protein